ncbi:hypothetical protein MGAD_31610 [Mycolicibacterium gadium]|uniref:Uncharacterized protein n=1 Tax=Mycolicibacterium gadium TaxID=1794 RepID=A0A7I7WMC9_MYCGU|nr:hypothetical protein MGAD_31610 [Mycolicibacterium gadium]
MALKGNAPVSIRRRGLRFGWISSGSAECVIAVTIADGGASYEITLVRDIDAAIGVKVRFAASRPHALGTTLRGLSGGVEQDAQSGR